MSDISKRVNVGSLLGQMQDALKDHFDLHFAIDQELSDVLEDLEPVDEAS